MAGVTKNVNITTYTGSTKAPGTTFTIETIGVNAFTGVYSNQPAVYGVTFENFAAKGLVNGGFTAALYYAGPSGGSGTWSLS